MTITHEPVTPNAATERKAAVAKLRRAGLSTRHIARTLGISQSAVMDSLPPRAPGQDDTPTGPAPLPTPAEWAEPMQRWVEWLTTGGTNPSTIRLRRLQLARFARDLECGPWQVTEDQLIGWCAARGWGAETRKSFKATARSFYRWAVKTGRTSVDPTENMPGVKSAPAVPRPAPDDRIRFALAGASSDVRLMIMLGAMCGLRRAEVAGLHSDDVSNDRTSLRVRGKGGRTRTVPLPAPIADAITSRPDGWVFPSPIKPGRPLTVDWVGRLIGQQLGHGVTPHMLRHRYATKAYAAERDLRAVQTLLGHSMPETTARYTQVPDGALRAAAAAAAL